MASLIDEYRRQAIQYGACTGEGDADGINRSHENLQRVFLSLVNVDQGTALFALYHDPNPWVQLAAAAHTLEIDEGQASAKLQELANMAIPHVSTDAKYTLEGWNNGDLRFLKS